MKKVKCICGHKFFIDKTDIENFKKCPICKRIIDLRKVKNER